MQGSENPTMRRMTGSAPPSRTSPIDGATRNLSQTARPRNLAVASTSSDNGKSQASAASIDRISALPVEILAMILSYVLVKEEQPVTLHSKTQRRWRNEAQSLVMSLPYEQYFQLRTELGVDTSTDQHRRYQRSSLTDVLGVSREFYDVGIKAFYGDNVLFFPNVGSLDAFLKKIDTDRKKCIKNLEMEVHWVLGSTAPLGPRFTVTAAQGTQLRAELFDDTPKLKVMKLMFCYSYDDVHYFLGKEAHDAATQEAEGSVRAACDGLSEKGACLQLAHKRMDGR